MAIVLGRLSKPLSQADIVDITSSAQTDSLRHGDVVRVLDRIFEWDHNCVTAAPLEQWRMNADDLADAALLHVFPSPAASTGQDLLLAVQSAAASDPTSPAGLFLDHVSRPPPPSLEATVEQIQRAQDFFWQNTGPIMSSLMHFSLAGGFASPRITRVLDLSSYLVPPHSDRTSDRISLSSTDRTFSRLMETSQYVIDVMGAPPPPLASPTASISSTEKAPQHCMVPLLGEGWRSTLRVRLLHATVRRRILARPTRAGKYDVSRDGLPINQEDLAATLASFSAAPLACMPQLGWIPTPQEAEDYIALWRHVGYYLGVSPDILERHFMSFDQAGKFLASCVTHLLDFSNLPEDAPVPPTIPILRAVSDRPPFRTTLGQNMALTRLLLGPALSDHLGVDRTSVLEAMKLKWTLAASIYPRWFGWLYPRKEWERRRVRITKEGMRRIIRFNLGLRRTAFRPRAEGEPHLLDEVKEAEAILPDIVGARQLVKEYRLMLLEMGLVTVSFAILGCVCTCTLASKLVDLVTPQKIIV